MTTMTTTSAMPTTAYFSIQENAMHTNLNPRAIVVAIVSLVFTFLLAAFGPVSHAAEMDAYGLLSLSARQSLAEEIGEEGARAYARTQGWQTIYNAHTPNCIPQGHDQVYKNPTTGRTIVVESKGGNASVRQSYGYQQGTSEWAVKSAERTLKSSKASLAQKEAARLVIDSAKKGMLDVVTVQTPHIRGVPGTSVVKNRVSCSPEAMRMAKEIYAKLKPVKGAAAVSRVAAKGLAAASRTAVNGLAPVASAIGGAVTSVAPTTFGSMGSTAIAVAGNVGSAASSAVGSVGAAASAAAPYLPYAAGAVTLGVSIYDVETRYNAGEITHDYRVKSHVNNTIKTTAGLGGAYLGATGGATAGAAIVGVVTGGLGAPIGGLVGGVVGGVAGYFGGEGATGYLLDRIW